VGVQLAGFYFDIDIINSHPIILSIIAVVVSLYQYMLYIERKDEIQIAFIVGYSFPKCLIQGILKAYPHLNASQAEEIIEHLRQYFIKYIIFKYQITIVSYAVDHSLELFSKINPDYKEFCRTAFSKPLIYRSSIGDSVAFMPSRHSLLEALSHPLFKKRWIDSCHDEKIDPLFPYCLPKVFYLDEKLSIPGGTRYFIEKASYSHLFYIWSDAPSPEFISQEIRKYLSTDLPREEYKKNISYLTNKLEFYVNSKKWIKRYYEFDIYHLFRNIEDNDSLVISLFGDQSNLTEAKARCYRVAISNKRNRNHPDYDPSM